MKISKFREQLADREAIRDCLARYVRGTDRIDRKLLDTVFWPDATVDLVYFSGSAAEYIVTSLEMVRQMDQTVHFLGNILIEIDGSRGVSEAYLQAYHRLRGDDDSGPRDLVVGGRYLDMFEKRDDEWRILGRKLVIDWFRHYEDSADWESGILGMKPEYGTRAPVDMSYAWLRQDAKQAN